MSRKKLKQQLIDKNPQAWSQVYEHYYNVITLSLNDDELAHDTMAEVYKALERYNPDYKLTQWIFGIAKNLRKERSRFQYRKGLRYEDLIPENSSIDRIFHDGKARTPLSVTVQRDLLKKVEEAAMTLQPRTKEVFMLYLKNGMDTNSIAEKLNITKKETLNRINYAKKLLKNILSRYYTEKFIRILKKPDGRLKTEGAISRYVAKDYRVYCKLRFIDKKTIREIANITSTPEKTVRFRIERALMQMKPNITGELFRKLQRTIRKLKD